MSGPWGEPWEYPQPPRRHVGRTVVVVVLVVVVVAAAVGAGLVALSGRSGDGSSSGPTKVVDPPKPSESGPTPAYPAALAKFYQQKLRWKACEQERQTTQCATLTVPLDYAHPDGRTITLAVLRRLADDRAHRIGQLVVDPGGPGVPATSYAEAGSLAFGLEVARAYDIVGMDPRGVGESTPIECLDTKGTDALLAADPSPDDAAEVTELDRVVKALGDGCAKADAELAAHISTVEAAKDMDVLRGVLGERKLDYFGASYGTYLGATYADLFPRNVRRMVLDGGVDPTLDQEQLSLGQAGGFETAIRAYVADCQTKDSCPLPGDVDQGIAKIKDLVDGADADPLPTGQSRKLNSALAQTGVFFPMYVKQLWPVLTQALTSAFDDRDGRGLLALADQLTSRSGDGYDDNSNVAIYAISCLDHPDAVPDDEIPSLYPEFEKASPSFGRSFAWTLVSCLHWPAKTRAKPLDFKAQGAPPIVVIGTTRDPATPYRWSQALARTLSSGTLITRDGDGHTGFHLGNQCVDDAVETYLLKGTPPKPDLHC